MLSPSIPEMSETSGRRAPSVIFRLESRLSPAVCLLLWLALFHVLNLIYNPAFRAPFVYDDLPNIVYNEDFRAENPIPHVIGNHPASTQYDRRPVSGLLTWLNFHFSGLNVSAFRAVNIVIHWFCAGAGGLLIFLIASKAGAAAPRLTALSSAVVWAVHPVNSTAVIYINQRQETLMTLFFLCSCLCLMLSTRGRGALWRGLSVVCALLSLFSKENAAGLPVVLLALDCLLVTRVSLREVLRRHRNFYEILILLWAAAFYWIMSGVRPAEWDDIPALGTPWAYFKSQCRVVFDYFRLLVWPTPLIFAPVPRIMERVSDWLPYGLALTALFAGLALKALKWSWLWIPWLVILLVLGPTSSFIPVPLEPSFDYRMHLPALAALATLSAIFWNRGFTGRRSFGLTAFFFGTATAALAIATFNRAGEYAIPESIWLDTVRKEPVNAKAWLHLSHHLAHLKRLEEARMAAKAAADINRALRLPWLESESHRALGFIAERGGEWGTALEEYGKAAALLPGNQNFIIPQARTLIRQGRHKESLDLLEPLCAQYPGNVEAGLWKAHALLSMGRSEEAFSAAPPAGSLKAPPPEIREAMDAWERLRAGGAVKQAEKLAN